MLNQLKADVLAANRMLRTEKLVVMTWGNVSGYDQERGLVVIKASGIDYGVMTLEHLVVVDLEGNIVEGDCRPSMDLDTHLEIYRSFNGIRGVVHTHSMYATIWAQTGEGIPCYGTTHADYFYGKIPCTRKMSADEIGGNYELNTGKVIAEAFAGIDPLAMRAVLVAGHGPFIWGDSPLDALHNAVILENVAKMASFTRLQLGSSSTLIEQSLLDRHYKRKWGPDAYYGQNLR